MAGEESARSVQELVLAAQTGSREAFDQLVERHRWRLESMLRLRIGALLLQRIELEDVVQETCMQAFQSVGEFQCDDEGSFFRWLRGIAEHVVKNLARYHFGTKKRDARLEVPLLGGVPVNGSGADWAAIDEDEKAVSPEDLVRRHERFDRLEAALDMLSPDDREVILLSWIEGLDTREVARRMGRSPNATCMLLLRALRKLRKHFGSTESLHLPHRCFPSPPTAAGSPDMEDPAHGQ